MRRAWLLLLTLALAGCSHRGMPALSACEDNEQAIATALGQFAVDNGGVYPYRLEQLVPKYLKTIPTCPAASRDTYSASYSAWHSHKREPGGPRASYTFYCSGRNHVDADVSADRPRCTPDSGVEK